MKLLKKMRYIFSLLLVVFPLFSITPAAHGFFTISAGRQLDEIKFMMQKVHEPQWKIGYRYGADCKPEERQNGKELQEAISASLRVWLQPLKELQPERPIVDKFVYELQPDFNPINPEDRYNLNEPEDLAGWKDVDLRVTFQCREGISFALIGGKFQPAVVMRLGTAITPALLAVLTHELGHAFGLDDTFTREATPPGVMQSHGGLHNTAGKQPASVMAFSFGYHSDTLTPLALGEDDKRGIIWLYKYFHADVPPNDCFFDDYVYVRVQEPYLMHRCAPKYPLIFEVKHNPTRHALQILKDDPSIDINAQDASGMTALHYAVMYEKEEVVKALLVHKDIKPSLKDRQGRTPLDIALAANHTAIIEMFPHPPPRLAADVNGDGTVNIQDLVQVAANFGETGENPADVNGDGQVNIQDLVAVAAAFGETAAAPAAPATIVENLTATEVKQWLHAAQSANLTDPAFQRGVEVLKHLLSLLVPKETVLLANYPNPFNPETWIPYQLAKPAEVTLHIHAVDGSLVRTLSLGHKATGSYQNRTRAAYWDGRNSIGEPVASGVYFYTLTAGEFTSTRKMLIRK